MHLSDLSQLKGFVGQIALLPIGALFCRLEQTSSLSPLKHCSFLTSVDIGDDNAPVLAYQVIC